MAMRLLEHANRLIADQRGTFLVGYSSLVLLVAIAALALLGNAAGALPH